MAVLRIDLDAVTASFRFPHFLIGRQPSYEMPPPATILGLVAAALGEYPEPGGLRFAYAFSAAARVDDMEKAHITEIGGSVPREDRGRFPYPVNVTAMMGPLMRELFIRPHLVLYLDAPDRLDGLYGAFRAPRYAITLGRSQDLVSMRRVDVIEPEERDRGYVEGTLLSPEERDRFPTAVRMMMPRYIDPNDRRRVEWGAYLALTARMLVVPESAGEITASRRHARDGERFAVDPDSPEIAGMRRAIVWHPFVGDGP
jgi:CRISPR-associated protein Cas5t